MPRPFKSQINILRFAPLAVSLSACVAIVVPVPQAPVAKSGASAHTAVSAPASCAVPADARSEAAEVLRLVNAHRTAAGHSPLMPSPALASAAQAFACDLAAQGKIGHVGSDGSGLRARFRQAGITAGLMAENVAAGQADAATVVRGWMNSPRHRENILRPSITRMGLGLARAGQLFWVIDLGS